MSPTFKQSLILLALAGAGSGAMAQATTVGSTIEVLASEGPNGSAYFGYGSLYTQPLDGTETPAALQALNQASLAVTRQACALPASEMGGRTPKLYAYKLEVVEVRNVERQSRLGTPGRSKAETWARVVFRPRPDCTGWMRTATAGPNRR